VRIRSLTFTALLASAGAGCVDAEIDAAPGPDDAPIEVARVQTSQGVRTIGFQRLGDGMAIFDGDILIKEADLEAARVDGPGGAQRSAITTIGGKRWPNGVIPFEIASNLPNPSRVTSAIAHWEANTPYRFVQRTNQSDFLRFVVGNDACSSPVGRSGGAQEIRLELGCGRGAIIHELGHAVGFFHEQSRHDRDDYVTIHKECVDGDKGYNFDKYSDGADVGPYDYGSIMHYDRFAFSNGCETITPKDPRAPTIGQRSGLSVGDILGAWRIFTGRRPTVTPLRGDFDGDRKADLSIKDETGAWRIDFAANGFGSWDVTVRGYGGSDAVPALADYDGDGKTDLSIKSTGGVWYIDLAANGFNGWDPPYDGYGGYGNASAIPVPADYDGDGKADLSVKTSDGHWLIDYSSNGFGVWNLVVSGYGDASAIPVPADYDGDGKADLSVKNSLGEWHVDYASDGFGAWNRSLLGGYGNASAIPVPADYDGDGKADLSVKNSLGEWHIDYASDGFGAWNRSLLGGYGNAQAIPVPADYDGDRKADLSVKDSGGAWLFDYAADDFGAWGFYLLLGA